MAAERGVDELLCLVHKRVQVRRAPEALRVDLVDALRARWPGREPPARGHDLQAADRGVVARGPGQLGGYGFAGEPITAKLSQAPGNGAPIDGVKIVTASGWFAARPSGTENVYKIYAESFRGDRHLDALVHEAQTLVDTALGRGA